MSIFLKEQISELLSGLNEFTSSDILVDIGKVNAKVYNTMGVGTISMEDFPRKIYLDAEKSKKESGTNPMCRAVGVVELEVRNKLVRTPILLTPIECKQDKHKRNYKFESIDETTFINPFLVRFLTVELEIPIDFNIDLDEINKDLSFHGFQVDIEASIIGNFHHHRFEILKELDDLSQKESFNSSFKSLFGIERESKDVEDLSAVNLYPADIDHEAVFEQVMHGDTVVQGPPGTGKSQVLSNLVAKFISGNKTVLAVSEKRVALEVLRNKLQSYELDKLAFIAGSDGISKELIIDLKKTWDFFENYVRDHEVNISLSEQREDQLQFIIDVIGNPILIGGISYDEFREKTKSLKLGNQYLSEAPLISDFCRDRSFVKSLYELELVDTIKFIKPRRFKEEELYSLGEQVMGWSNTLLELKENFNLKTWRDLSEVMKEASFCQVLENENYKRFHEIFKIDSKNHKKYLKLRKQFLKGKQPRLNGLVWKRTPSKYEVQSLLEKVKNSGVLDRVAIKMKWKKLSHVPFSKMIDVLTDQLSQEKEDQKEVMLKAEFMQLGIEEPEREVVQIDNTLSTFPPDLWKVLNEIPLARKQLLTRSHRKLEKLHRGLRSSFDFPASLDLIEYFELFKRDFGSILERDHKLKIVDTNLLSFIKNAPTIRDYEQFMYSSHLIDFKRSFPSLSKFTPQDISSLVEDIIHLESREAKLFSREILGGVKRKFDEYHLLLNTPAKKLREEEKAKKKELRKGKALLVKEFGKSRSHSSLRTLFNSDARLWIQLLKPFWLSNPSQLAKSFPMDQGLFDHVIIDEASQIPIQNALGAIYRSSNAIVAGDEHQMGPTSYFKTKSSESIDLLHQASYYFPSVSLKHHYRSMDPALVAFSNKHFYENQLAAYPSPRQNENVLKCTFVEDGRFIERRNKREAQELLLELRKLCEGKGSIGVVAFSEEQLKQIWECMDSKLQNKFTEHIDTNGGFFKALENVQGDECDHLIISFGYGRDESGIFSMRFGPLNLANGRRRLNVLLTRAIKSLNFYCSVKAADFKLSENESINLLRQWFGFMESYNPDDSAQFPGSLDPSIDGDKLTFKRIQSHLPNAKEIVTLHRVLTSRGWKVEYD